MRWGSAGAFAELSATEHETETNYLYEAFSFTRLYFYIQLVTLYK